MNIKWFLNIFFDSLGRVSYSSWCSAMPHPLSIQRQADAILRWHNEFESICGPEPEHSSQPGHSTDDDDDEMNVE